ncbi:VirK family protein [Lysobacter sp. CA199]|uniref:VirK family protein n=1 Tax=Lysobacter sp. CA199 TaxID=3455608 RepID=UPI003F8D7170
MVRIGLFSLTAAAVLSATSASARAAEDSIQTQRLRHYDGVRALLFAGVPVTAVFTPGQCGGPHVAGTAASKAASKAAIPEVSGGFAVRDFIEVKDSNIGFANQHLTVRPDGSAVLELVQYRLLPDDTATVKTNFLSPVTYQAVSPPLNFQCKIGQGLDFVAY